MDNNFTLTLSLSLLTIIFLTFLVVRHYNKMMNRSKSALLVADHNLGKWESSLSIAASWIWAPALFISAQKSYQDGFIGLFWFIVPNILCLVLFAHFAKKIRAEHPEGFTISSYIREKTSNRVQILYWVSLVGLALCAFSVQLLAGGQLLSKITNIPFFICTLILGAVPLSYSLFSGLKATIFTDLIKMIFVYSISLILIPWAIISAGGFDLVVKGIGGRSQSLEIFGADSLRIFLTFGLPTTIGLLSGPFGDQTFWQRAFAVEQRHVKSVFLYGAFFFAIVPLLISLLGFAAAGSSFVVKDPQLVNLEFINQSLPPVAGWIFVSLVIIALISILDTKLTAIASLGAHDIVNMIHKTNTVPFKETLLYSRMSMILLFLGALAIANIPDLKILHLFLFYGTLRSATMIPTILLILKKPLTERGVFYGILTSLVLGLPIFAFGNLKQLPSVIVTGSILTVASSGTIAWLLRKRSSSEFR